MFFSVLLCSVLFRSVSLITASAAKSEERDEAYRLPRSPEDRDKTAVKLNSTDTVYSDIRGLSIEQLGAFLQERAIKIRESYQVKLKIAK